MSEPVRVLPDDEHNRRLVSHVRPPDWRNPESSGRYNLVVLGAGTAGLITAIGSAGLGARVALVERELMGGDCLNVGCVPSKGLLRAARAAADVRNAGAFGVCVPPGVRVDFASAMERMRRIRAAISLNDSAARYREAGVDVFFGSARFVGRDAVEVGGRELRFSKAVIATGARAIRLPIPGLNEAGALTNETVFSLTELPRRLLVIGAGPIGVELAQAFRRFGSEVTLIEALHGILPREDRDAARIVRRALERDGVRFVCCVKTEKVERNGKEKVVHMSSAHADAGLQGPQPFDDILIGVGRAPNVEGMGLEAAGVDFDPGTGVRVDDFLRTSNRSIFAAGDVCSPHKFTHAADAMARIAIQNALFPGRKKRVGALTIPWCTYTDPEIAHVGLYEEEAKDRGLAVRTFSQDFAEVDRALLDGESEGLVKVHVRDGSDQILGATVVTRHAGEMITELTLAMTHKLGLGRLASTIHPYPTQSEAVKRVADQYNRTRLTPAVKRIFETWLRWTR